VLGREFALRLLAEVVQDGNNLEAHISALKQREFLYERSTAEGPVFTFKHVLTQEVAYDSLLSGRCQALHEAAGRALERLSPDRIEEHCELLAYHFSRCADREKALDYLELANRKAIRANAVFDAKAYFEDALRTLDALPDTPAYRRRRIELFIPQVHVFILANQLDQYERHLERGAAIAESLADDGLRGHFLACVGHTQFMLSRMPEALATLERAGALCERAGNSGGAGHAYAHLQWTHLERGEFEDALRYEPPALLALDRAPDLRLRVYSLSATSIAYAYLGCWDIAVERAQAALRDSEAVSDPSLVCFAQWVLCIAYTQKGAVEAAAEWGRRSYETAPTPGDRGWAQVCYGSACALCEPGLAIDLLEPVSEMYASAGALFHEAWAKVGLGNAYLAAGRLPDARRVLTRALEAAQSCTCFMVGGPAERLLGEVALAEGSAEALTESQQRFERVIELFRRSKAQNELALAYSGCGRLHARLGQHGRAREYLSLALGIFEGLGTPGQPELVRVELATLAG
jgi:tetratricopeptide (TPR) repeat protein